MDFMFTIKWIEASSIIIIIVIVNLTASFSHALCINLCISRLYTHPHLHDLDDISDGSLN